MVATKKVDKLVLPSDIEMLEREYSVSRAGAERIANGESPDAVRESERTIYRVRYEKITNAGTTLTAVADARQAEIDRAEAEHAKIAPPAEHTAPESGPYTAAADYEEVELSPEAIAAETGISVADVKETLK